MPPARATLLPTPGLCKSSRLPWRAVLLSAPSKHCARRRLLAHTPEAKPRASGLAPCSHLSVPRTPLPGGRWNSAKGQLAALAGNRTRVNCLEGSYAHHYTTNACLVSFSNYMYKSNRGYDSANVFQYCFV